ncbi:MAG: M48 family peptidase, partial [Proteobacteria bacterium]|nr:M48 family peptidase [Pseudomonadota bacterium]
MNLFTILFLIGLGASIIVQWFLVLRHIKHISGNRQKVPEDFSDKIPIEAHQKAADYTQAKVKTGLVELIIGSIFLLLWTIAGGLQYLDSLWRSLSLSEIWTGTGFILSVFAIMAILDLPMSIFRTFKLEQSFGFNKMTPKIFIMDIVKNAIVGLIIGTPSYMSPEQA